MKNLATLNYYKIPGMINMKTCFTLLFFFTAILSYSQTDDLDKQTKAIEQEGKRLYEVEMASWYGTDLFMEKYTNRENIGGYFSYMNDSAPTCIFFNKSEKPKVIGTIAFDNTYNTTTAKVDLTERAFNPDETTIYNFRQAALTLLGKDTLFKMYQNTTLNVVPLLSNGEKKVYILTAPQKSGVVIFGNDYLLRFDNENKLIEKKQLHKNLIPIYYDSKELEGKTVEETMHSHLPETGDFITPTDVCTLMLYAKFANWKQHTVVSANYLSFWNCQTNELLILTKEAVDKIYKHQQKRKKQ